MKELDLQSSNDTLGRWMAHHVAALITQAEHPTDPATAAAATEHSVATILRLWEHRATADRLNPLADLTSVLTVLSTLAEDPLPWAHHGVGRPGQAASQTYELLRRLIMCLILLELGGIDAANAAIARAGRTQTWQSEHEREFVEHLTRWLRVIETQNAHVPELSDESETEAEPERVDLAVVALDIVDKLEASLPEIRNVLRLASPDASEARR